MTDYNWNCTIGNSRNQAEEERLFDLRNENICHKWLLESDNLTAFMNSYKRTVHTIRIIV